MEKVYGSPKRQDGLFKISYKHNKWELIYGFGKDKETDETGWNWRKRFIGVKPTIEECRQVITAQINVEVQQKILTGFMWFGVPVWLSTENQLNFARIERCGADYPLTLKIGEIDGVAEYHEFKDADEFKGFCKAYNKFILDCLQEGWKEKDNININF